LYVLYVVLNLTSDGGCSSAAGIHFLARCCRCSSQTRWVWSCRYYRTDRKGSL